jgi:hypothetical protein
LGEKGGEGLQLVQAHGWGTSEGTKAQVSVGFVFNHGPSHAQALGEKGAEGESLARNESHATALGEKGAEGAAETLQHAFAVLEGEKGGEGEATGHNHGWGVMEGTKGLALVGFTIGYSHPYATLLGEKGGEGLANAQDVGTLTGTGLKASDAQALLQHWNIDRAVGAKGSIGEALENSHPNATVIGLKSSNYTANITGSGYGLLGTLKDVATGVVIDADPSINTSGQKAGVGNAEIGGTPLVIAIGIKGSEGITSIHAAPTVAALGLKGGTGETFVLGHGYLHGTQTIAFDAETVDFIRTITRTVSPDLYITLTADLTSTITTQPDLNMYIVTVRDITLEA